MAAGGGSVDVVGRLSLGWTDCVVASVVGEHCLLGGGLEWLWVLGSVDPQHMGSAWMRNQNSVPCMAGGLFTSEPARKSSVVF